MTTRFTSVLFLAAACGGSGSDPEGPEPGSGDIPASLLDIEGRAENAYDVALADDAAAFATEASAIER
jgi:hypothetical protein